MSDFLSNLVERSLSPIASVRPQLFSIFEPPSINGGAFFRGNQDSELTTAEHHHQEWIDWHSRLLRRTSVPPSATQVITTRPKSDSTSAESAELPSVQAQIRAGVDFAGKEGNVALSRARGAAGHSTAQEEAGAGPLRPQLPSDQTPIALSANKPLPHDLTKDRPQERRAEKIIEMESPEREAHREVTQVRDIHLASANKPVAQDSTNDGSHEPSARKIVEMEPPERDPHREVIQVRDVHAVSRQAPSSRSIARAPQPKNVRIPPAINVTIGRVEIRAVPPPVQQRMKPKPASMLSLEDYLRQRSKGVAR